MSRNARRLGAALVNRRDIGRQFPGAPGCGRTRRTVRTGQSNELQDLYILSAIKILWEYESGVIFRLGRLLPHAKGPGIILVFAPVDRVVRISLRQEALEVKPQDIITRDGLVPDSIYEENEGRGDSDAGSSHG